LNSAAHMFMMTYSRRIGARILPTSLTSMSMRSSSHWVHFPTVIWCLPLHKVLHRHARLPATNIGREGAATSPEGTLISSCPQRARKTVALMNHKSVPCSHAMRVGRCSDVEGRSGHQTECRTGLEARRGAGQTLATVPHEVQQVTRAIPPQTRHKTLLARTHAISGVVEPLSST